MESAEVKIKDSGSFKCTSCGAELKYKPGTTHLTCEYCGASNEIPVSKEAIEELDFNEFLTKAADTADQITIHAVNCKNCGATSSVDPKIESTFCPYCSTPLIEKNAKSEQMVRPKSLLPFKLDPNQGKEQFKSWVKSLWFAPDALMKAVLNFDHFKGVYLPFWTYDSGTVTVYTGDRGQYYYVTETYSTTENGKSVTRTREVRHTRWHSTNGTVSHFFDDVLACASQSVPTQYVHQLEPWDLQNLVPFDEKYLSGYITEKYQVDMKQGFEMAKEIMKDEIVGLIHHDIGGDEQRINSMDTRYSDITFKHILLPAYISAYNYKGKLFRFLVNARTGEVQGERPWSWTKIAFAVIGGIIVAVTLYYMFGDSGS